MPAAGSCSTPRLGLARLHTCGSVLQMNLSFSHFFGSILLGMLFWMLFPRFSPSGMLSKSKCALATAKLLPERVDFNLGLSPSGSIDRI